MKPFQKILVPVDFSPHSAQAIRTAAELSARFDASVTLIHVQEPLDYALPEGYVVLTAAQIDSLTAELAKLLAVAKSDAEAAGARGVATRQLNGIASLSIVEFAKSEPFDLIVMGTHGRTGLRHALMGSVAERVLRTAPCPVLTVKATPSRERRSAIGRLPCAIDIC